jgi:hypothetical protein
MLVALILNLISSLFYCLQTTEIYISWLLLLKSSLMKNGSDKTLFALRKTYFELGARLVQREE